MNMDHQPSFDNLGQFTKVSTFIGFLEVEKLILLQTRYMINKEYAAAKTHTTEPNSNPRTSEEKKSSIKYPLITITRTATSHDIV